MPKISTTNLKAVPFTKINIQDGFWKPKLKVHKDTTLKVCLDQCESTGRIANFAKAAGILEGEFEGIFFNDSDVYKVLEGVSYSLMTHPDADLERRVDDIIALIAAAQEKDGYLLCYFTLVAPEKKWTDMDKHEMYCGGHLMEAAVAYYHATGKRKLLDVACKLADHYDAHFGPGKRHWVPGHEEIELALVKLYKETNEERYWKLAKWLLEERGHGNGSGTSWDREGWGPAYCQDDKPVFDMTDVRGHAVRAMYLYSGMADVATISGDKRYVKALDHLWDSVVNRNMYVTGGIGPSKHNEGFTEDYDLPNDTAYCETCASIGMVLWSHRMNLLHQDSKYVDILEKAMYNGALSGVSLQGDKFFYVNPLSTDGSHHRVEWFDCSCCPTQIARFIPSIGNYVYATKENSVYTNLFIQGEGELQLQDTNLTIKQTTNYPWDGKVEFEIEPDQSSTFTFSIRTPGWCESADIMINGIHATDLQQENGYIRLYRSWEKGDKVIFNMVMPVGRIHAHPKVKANKGKVALQRGPIVYCMEQCDHNFNIKDFTLEENIPFITEYKENLLDGVTILKGKTGDGQSITLVPYYAWDNREEGSMDVWLPEEDKGLQLYK